MDIKAGRYQIDASDADLSHSRFRKVTLRQSSLEDVDMSALRVENATVRGATWTNVDLRELRISDANLNGASIAESTYDGMTIDGIAVTELLRVYRAAGVAAAAAADGDDRAAGSL